MAYLVGCFAGAAVIIVLVLAVESFGFVLGPILWFVGVYLVVLAGRAFARRIGGATPR